MGKKTKKTFADKAYRRTSVKVSKSQDKLLRMLEELGITDIRITQRGSDYTIEFLVRLQNNEGARKVRMNLPLEVSEETEYEHGKEVLFRVLYHHLRDKFIAVQRGLKEFEEEFLADLVIVADGQEQRLGDILVPRYKEQLKTSKIAVLHLTKTI